MSLATFKKTLATIKQITNFGNKSSASLQLPNTDKDAGIEHSNLLPPSTSNFGVKRFEQTWDREKDEWTNVIQSSEIKNRVPHFQLYDLAAYNRRDGSRPYRSHIWIVFHNASLVDLLKPHFEGLGGLTGQEPGIDARHVYARRDKLKSLVVERTNDQDVADEMKQANEGLQALLSYVDDVFADVTAQLEHTGSSLDQQVEWSSLWALFTKGDLIEIEDRASGQNTSMRLGSWVYRDQIVGEPVFEVQGKYLQWTGSRYVSQSVSKEVEKYEYAGRCHLQYQSSMVYHDPDRVSFLGDSSKPMKAKADGRVMIDMLSYRRFNPNLDRWDSDDLYGEPDKHSDWLLAIDASHADLCTLPPTIYGWSFAAKKWGGFLVEKLSDISFDHDVFENLVLPDDNKRIIQSLVEAQAGFRGISLFSDMASGKGAGLVILLHGGPGTGKTLTAEAISEHLKLPLYAVSCNEFGVQLETVESKLKHILEITSLWKSVVLIDETEYFANLVGMNSKADIFLEARAQDLSRNAVVGVFLRMLEYHSGIVILTTNRVQKFDDAFQSRISLALKYKDFDQNARKILWKRFLRLAGARVQDSEHDDLYFEFTCNDIDRLASRNVNGRTIRQIVRTSQALALHDEQELNPSHVAKVWQLLDDFEADLQSDTHRLEDQVSEKV